MAAPSPVLAPLRADERAPSRASGRPGASASARARSGPREGQPVTVYVSIGNSDDKLSQSDWSAFTASVREVLRRHASVIHGEWYSAPDAAWQNACFCAEFTGRDLPVKLAFVKSRLEEIRRDYRQDSIAWAVVPETEFI